MNRSGESDETMNTCDTCKFWSLRTDLILGDCACPKFILGYNRDGKIALPDGVIVEDDEGWGFATAPKFGCVHHFPIVTSHAPEPLATV